MRPVSTDSRMYHKGEDPEHRYRKPFRQTNPLDPEYKLSQAPATSLYHNWAEEVALGGLAPIQTKIIGPVAG